MTTVFDKPKTSGDLTYSNTGSCARLVNYEISNKEKLNEENTFFSRDQDKLTPEEAKNLIDNNVKGLKANEEKFYSFSINPSADELSHIGNDKEKLKLYTRQVMENYAKNFNKLQLTDKDVVWTAIVHDTRYYTHEDVSKYKKDGKKQDFTIGDKKPGNNLHVHLIVSRRDSNMKHTLTLRGKGAKEKFSLFDFQKKNQEIFQRTFNYKPGVDIYKETQIRNITKQVNSLNSRFYLSEDEVLKIAQKHNYSGQIAYNLKSLQKSVDSGKRIDDPYRFIEIGRTQYNKEKRAAVTNNLSEAATLISNLFESIGSQKEASRGEVPDLSDYTIRNKRKRKRKFNL